MSIFARLFRDNRPQNNRDREVEPEYVDDNNGFRHVTYHHHDDDDDDDNDDSGDDSDDGGDD